jgi:hypothetical protein
MIVEKVKQFFSSENKEIFKFIKKEKYPCKECLVVQVCSELCDKVEIDEYKIFNKMITNSCCPDCGGTKLYEGSSGGCCQNIFCTNCNHGFNVTAPFEKIERIGKMR